MPSAIRKDLEFAEKGLVTILVESQGADDKKLEGFLWKRFPDNQCYTSVGVFVPIPESRGIPHGALVGVDGKLLWAGHPLGDKQIVEKLVSEQLKLVKKGWGDTSEARKVRAQLFGKGNLAGAAALVAAMPEGQEQAKLQKEVDDRYAVQKAAIEALQKQGCWLKAKDAASALQKAVGRHETWSGEVADIVAAFASEEGKAELAADKKLARIEKLMRKGKVEKAPKALEKLIAKIGGTSVEARARRTLAALTAGS